MVRTVQIEAGPSGLKESRKRKGGMANGGTGEYEPSIKPSWQAGAAAAIYHSSLLLKVLHTDPHNIYSTTKVWNKLQRLYFLASFYAKNHPGLVFTCWIFS